MISCYFGPPGCGKTTLGSFFAKKYKKNYDHVYCNFFCRCAEKIDFNDLRHFKMYNSLIILDELTLDADSRDFKSFDSELRKFFVLHRHLNCDIIYLVQDYQRADKIIRDLTFDLWTITRSVVPFFKRFIRANRIYRHYEINEHTSELVLGYRYSSLTERIFDSNTKFVYAPKYYKLFDTHDELDLKDRPIFHSIPWDYNYFEPNKKHKFKKFMLNIRSIFAAKILSSVTLKKIFRKDRTYTSTTTEV